MLGKLKGLAFTCASPFWKLFLTSRGVSVGERFVCIGRPGLNLKRGTSIEIGNGVTLCNTGMANPVAEGGRCRLATVAPGAKLTIADRVGMSSTVICCALEIKIGESTQIGGGAMILDTDFHPRGEDGSWLTDPSIVAKPVSIGKNCFIGARAIILKGVTLGDGAVVGAGAVVTRSVPPGDTVAGNPAVSIKR